MTNAYNVEPLRSEEATNGSLLYTFLISFVAAIGGFMFGYDLNIISGAQQYLKVAFSLDERAFGFANSSALLGCLAGPFLGAWLCDRAGRKRTLIVAAILFAISAIGTALPRTIFEFNFFRVIGGVGVGLASIASPMYIAEIAPRNLRGRLVTMNQLAIVVGGLISIVVAYLIARNVSESVSWRWMFASVIVPIAVFMIFLVQLPETPRWLAQRQRVDEARKILTHINGPTTAAAEFEGIQAEIVRDEQSPRTTLAELWAPGIRLAVILGVALSLMSQWTGWSMVAFYMPTIYRLAGIESASDAIYWTIIPYFANLLFTIVAIYLIDWVGRRPLYLVFSLAMAAAMSLLGAMFIWKWEGWPVVLILSLAAAPHAIALGALSWLVVSEIFPTRIRATAMSFCTIFLWLACFSLSTATPTLFKWSTDTFGNPSAVFFGCAGVCVASFLFLLKFLPETKQKTLEEIARFWSRDAEVAEGG
jgi:sugar porter (SP) family MFS transporter